MAVVVVVIVLVFVFVFWTTSLQSAQLPQTIQLPQSAQLAQLTQLAQPGVPSAGSEVMRWRRLSCLPLKLDEKIFIWVALPGSLQVFQQYSPILCWDAIVPCIRHYGYNFHTRYIPGAAWRTLILSVTEKRSQPVVMTQAGERGASSTIQGRPP